MSSRSDYEAAARACRELPEPAPDANPDVRSWVRAGSLAANSHNTQPWRIRLDGVTPSILIRPDRDRRCPAVDPDDAHLFKSLGCMVENIRIAAGVNGYETTPDLSRLPDEVRLDFRRSRSPGETDRYAAIGSRQCTRTTYDGSRLTEREREALNSAGQGDGVRTVWIDDPERIKTVVEYVQRGNDEQLGDPAFRRELVKWVRFSPGAALAKADGLSSLVMGQPALPQWLGRALAPLLIKPGPQNRKDAESIRSSSALAVLVAERNEPPDWIETGRVVQRLSLTATTLGLKHAYINQPIESRTLRAEFAHWLGAAPEHPLLMLRIGRSDAVPYSLRRPLQEFVTLSDAD